MKHLIIGTGVIGDATGYMLEHLGENVFYYDIEPSKLIGRKTLSDVTKIDIIWITTAEWDIDKAIAPFAGTDKIVIIRSTTQPGQTMGFGQKYHITNIAHYPEFLREKSARIDAITPDRVVVGVGNLSLQPKLRFLEKLGEVYWVHPNESEMIKLVANAHLSTLISFWNEIRLICNGELLNPERIIEIVKKDKRISKYGTHKLGAFKGFCLPKDLDQLILVARKRGSTTSWLLKAVKEVNEYIKVIRN